jgi:superfamily I DNA and/or RNA helicase
MLNKNTSKLSVGSVVSIDGRERKIIAKRKAFSAPEYFITFMIGNQEVTRVYHSNKKFAVVA